MIRRHENSVSFKAGVLSVGVHVALLIALLVSVNWKTTHTSSVAEVELWDSLPTQHLQKPVPPEPAVKEAPKPEPPKPVMKVEPPAPKIEPKADIILKKIEKKLEKPKELKKPDALAALQKQLMQDELEKDKKQKKDEALKKLQQEALADEKAEGDKQAKASKSAASASVIGEYSDKIRAKVQRNVNKTLCGDGKPKLVFEIMVMPTGDVQGNPKLIQSSKISACDDAVERAIMQSQPLPLPADASLREQFRNLRLEFHPNE
ncbi:MAG: TonB C-terminal domain-containing protein [Methylotenera sp.]|nr:TonB C-terminal domain-containing protein [Methylotenera sp.]